MVGLGFSLYPRNLTYYLTIVEWKRLSEPLTIEVEWVYNIGKTYDKRIKPKFIGKLLRELCVSAKDSGN